MRQSFNAKDLRGVGALENRDFEDQFGDNQGQKIGAA
jgi:hypothetical protein